MFSLCRAAAIVSAACLAHGIAEEDEDKRRFKEIIGCDYDDFMLLDSPDKYEGVKLDCIINPCKYHLYNDCFRDLRFCGGTGMGSFTLGWQRKYQKPL